MTIIKCSNCINYHSDSFNRCPSCGFYRLTVTNKKEKVINSEENNNKLGKLIGKFFKSKK